MGFIGDQVESIRSMQVRQVLSQIISLGDTRSPFPYHLLRLNFLIFLLQVSPDVFCARIGGIRGLPCE
jgi:hypothetical protein